MSVIVRDSFMITILCALIVGNSGAAARDNPSYKSADALDQAGKYSQAAEQARLAIKLEPESAPCYALHARCLAHDGKLRQALTAINIAVKKRPEELNWWRLRRDIYLRLNQLQEAQTDNDFILHRAPNDVQALSIAGFMYSVAGRLDPALKCYTAVISRQPQNSQALLARACIYHVRNQHALAHRDVCHAVDANINALSALGNLNSELRPKDLPKCTSWLKLANKKGVKTETKIAALITRAGVLMLDNKFDTALADLRSAEKLSQSFNPLLNKELAICYRMLGDSEQSIKYLHKLLEKDPNNKDVLAVRAMAYLDSGRTRAAVSDLSKLIRMDALTPEVGENVVVRLLKQGDDENAMAIVDQLIKSRPKTANFRIVKIRILMRHEQYQDAIKECDALIAIDPHSPDAQKTKSELLSKLRSGK
jgi:tetratricopeptide (TPR) repeat protein